MHLWRKQWKGRLAAVSWSYWYALDDGLVVVGHGPSLAACAALTIDSPPRRRPTASSNGSGRPPRPFDYLQGNTCKGIFLICAFVATRGMARGIFFIKCVCTSSGKYTLNEFCCSRGHCGHGHNSSSLNSGMRWMYGRATLTVSLLLLISTVP